MAGFGAEFLGWTESAATVIFSKNVWKAAIKVERSPIGSLKL